MSDQVHDSRVDRLLDAVELLREDRRDEALQLLRELIREDSDFEEAWLWMSVAVDSLDQSSLCLDNVLRINPENMQAAGALHRIREPEITHEQRRARLARYRDAAWLGMWLLTLFLLFRMLFAYM